MTLQHLFFASLVAGIGIFVWLQINVTRMARLHARNYCERVGVQFLDQNVVIKSMRPVASTRSLFALKRRYQFEFATVGDRRYTGVVTMVGPVLEGVELEPYKLDD